MDLASRARIEKNLSRLLEWQKKAWRAKETGQSDLFGGSGEPLPPFELEDTEPWTMMEALEAERQAIGFYLSGHPLDGFWELMEFVTCLDEVKKQNDLKYGSPILVKHRMEKEARKNRNVKRSR